MSPILIMIMHAQQSTTLHRQEHTTRAGVQPLDRAVKASSFQGDKRDEPVGPPGNPPTWAPTKHPQVLVSRRTRCSLLAQTLGRIVCILLFTIIRRSFQRRRH